MSDKITVSLDSTPSHNPGIDDDTEIHHRSISDDVLSPASASAPGAPTFATKSTASSLAAATKKLAFGGRKLLSPLAAAASGMTGGSLKTSVPTTSNPTATVDRSRTGSASSIADAMAVTDAAVTSAASAVSGFLFPGPSTTTTESLSPTTSATSPVPIQDPDQEAEYRYGSAQQRMQILEDLVQHRRADWSYLKSMHEGTHYWLNMALLREQQVLEHVGDRSVIRRSVQWFYLGLGLGRLIKDVHHTQYLAMEACQLLEELEFYFSSGAVQGMKLMVATNTTLYEPLHKMEDEALYSVQESFRPTIYKWNQRPVFRRLLTPSLVCRILLFLCFY